MGDVSIGAQGQPLMIEGFLPPYSLSVYVCLWMCSTRCTVLHLRGEENPKARLVIWPGLPVPPLLHGRTRRRAHGEGPVRASGYL